MWSSLEGLVIGGRYEIQRHIATGGMAAVFLSWDHRVERPVAIKVLRQLEHADGPSLARFQREAHAAAMLNHPHVVRAYDFLEDGGCYYLVMEYIGGINLKQHLRQRGALAAPEALRIAGQVSAALSAAHAQGFIHRDVKPQNILLDENGSAKVTDFGIVHITRGPTMTTDGAVLGTADYIAPEQARGEHLSPATDVYALGVVLYEMLTGRLPFTGPTPMAVATQHATAPLLPPRRLVPTLSPYVDAVAVRALQKQPERRYASAQAMTVAVRMAEEALRIPPPADQARVEPGDHRERASVMAAVAGGGVATPVEAGARAPADASRDGAATPALGAPHAGRRALAEDALDAMPVVADGGLPAKPAFRLHVAEDGLDEGSSTARTLPPLWLRALVMSATVLALLAGILVLQLWTHAHGGGLP